MKRPAIISFERPLSGRSRKLSPERALCFAIFLGLLVLSLGLLLGCGGFGSARPPESLPSSSISVAITPSSLSLQVNQTTQVVATIQNDPTDKGVTWTLMGAGCSANSCGTLTNITKTSVTYTAPASVPISASLSLIATSASDTTKADRITITITSAPNPIVVSINPAIAAIQVSQSATLVAAIQNDSSTRGVNWTLSGSGCAGAACGSLTNITTTSVTYTAPANVPNPAAVTVTATSIADGSKSSAATITITSAPQPISVSLTPSIASIQVIQSAPFTATVQNDPSNRGVNWTLTESGCAAASCGTLSNVSTTSATYTAPPNVPNPATVTLTATSVADNSKSSTATITITAAPPPIVVSAAPTQASVQVTQSAAFSATVQNDSSNRGVNWTLAGSGCAGASCGTLSNVASTSATYTAPSNVPNPATVTLTATSVADNSKLSTATITITAAAPPISVAVAPTSTSVQVNQSAPFTATVQNDSSNRGVTWTLAGSGCSGASCGTLGNVTTTSVTYTAPASVPNPATVTLTATSVADNSKSSTATITITAAPPPIVVSAAPTQASVQVTQSAAFSATVQNDSSNRGVNWTLSGSGCAGASCGTLTNVAPTSVTYVAPNAAPNPAQVTLLATSISDSTRSGSASITVFAPGSIRVTLSPKRAAITLSQKQQFTATVTGATSTGVSWSVDDVPNGNSSVGTINNGLYVPGTAVGRHTITAQSVIDTTSSASATIAVTDLAGVFSWRGVEGDTTRQGVNPKEYALDSTTVNRNTFGKLFSCSVDSYIYAQPLYMANLAIPGKGTHNVIFVATTNATVYAFDADSNANPCAPLWQKSLLGAGESAFTWQDTPVPGCEDVMPLIGLTATPVIDPVSRTLYAVTKTKDSSRNYFNRLHALSLSDGSESFGGPVLIQASVRGTGLGSSGGIVSFRQHIQYDKAGLLLSNGVVYTSWSSHCDKGLYNGWVIGYNAATLQSVNVFNTTRNGSEGSIWMSGAAPSADSSGNIYVISANGYFDLASPRTNFGDTALKLRSEDGDLTVVDYFTPVNQDFISSHDLDFGSTGAVLLPDLPQPQSHLMVGVAKDTTVYLIDRDNMGKFQSGSGGTDSVVQKFTVAPPWGVWTTPAFSNNSLFVVPGPKTGTLRPMFAYQFDPQRKCFTPCSAPSPASRTADNFPYPGGVPNLSSRGGSDNGIVWMITSDTANRGAMQLHAYDPADLSREFYDTLQSGVPTPQYVKFAVPTIANGRVYIGTQTTLEVFGLLPD